MKKNVLLGILIVFSSAIFSQDKKIDGPAFKFENELINYGKVKQHTDGKRVFTFINIGNAPLIISDIKTSCDCTVPEKPKDPIMPNEKGQIIVEYDTAIIGGFSKQITIFSNANTPRKTIRIKGFVVK